jgi:hypothetical protein
MIKWFKNPFKKKTLIPDLVAFHNALIRSVNMQRHDGNQTAADFRHLMLQDPELGKRVLFALLTWCDEYKEEIPVSSDELQRRAGKQEVASYIKSAMYADLNPR